MGPKKEALSRWRGEKIQSTPSHLRNQESETLTETFAPVVDFTIVRLVLAIAAQKNWHIHQVDYSSAFLQGKLDREVYMSIPAMLEGKHENNVCRLLKSLYGLREAPRIWYELLSADLARLGLLPMPSTHCVFRAEGIVILCYVDDLFVLTESVELLDYIKDKLSDTLPAKDMGLATDFLGIKLVHEPGSVTLLQTKYIDAIISAAGLENSKAAVVPSDPTVDLSTVSEEGIDDDFQYRSLIGSLLYIATRTRPDIAVVTSMLARHVEQPSKKQQYAVIKLLKYLKGTRSIGLKLEAGEDDQLYAYVDANWAGEP